MKLRSYFRAESEKVLLKDDDDTFGSDHHDIMKTFERVGWIEDDMLGVDSISIGLDNSMKHDGDEDLDQNDNLELWKEYHGDIKDTANDELAVFAAANWRQKLLKKGNTSQGPAIASKNSEITNTNGKPSSTNIVSNTGSSIQSALALFSDVNNGDQRNEEIDFILQAAQSKDILRKLSFAKYGKLKKTFSNTYIFCPFLINIDERLFYPINIALNSSRISKYRHGTTVVRKFKLLKTWKAHTNLISSVLSFPSTNIIVSSSFDCKATVWNSNYKINLGTFLQGGPTANWGFPADQCFRKYRARSDQRLERIVMKRNSKGKHIELSTYLDEGEKVDDDNNNKKNSKGERRKGNIVENNDDNDTQPLTRKFRRGRLKNQKKKFKMAMAKHMTL